MGKIDFLIEKKNLRIEILSSVAGAKADSLYDIAVRNGYVGTEQEFIDSLYVAIEQTIGQSTTAVMSQKAVTDALGLKLNVDDIVVMSEAEYEAEQPSEEGKYYFTYEDETTSDESIDTTNHVLTISSISSGTAVSQGTISNNTLTL